MLKWGFWVAEMKEMGGGSVGVSPEVKEIDDEEEGGRSWKLGEWGLVGAFTLFSAI